MKIRHRQLKIKQGLIAWVIAFTLNGTFAFIPGSVEAVEIATPAKLTIPDYANIRARMLAWIAERQNVSEQEKAVATNPWPAQRDVGSPDEVWELALKTFARLDGRTATFLEELSRGTVTPGSVDSGLLYETERGDFYLSNVRLHYARWLTQREFVEPGLELLNQINTSELISPAAYLFYKSACERRLLQREAGLKTIDQLLALPESSPRRYWQLARLVREEWSAVKENSLEDVSMLMDDVQRRLKLAQPGQKTQNVEEQVVKLLDDLIRQMEENQNQSQAGAGEGHSKGSPQSPAEDSRIHGSRAPGEVDPKSMKPGADWGNLDSKQRAKVENLISRDFPAHYRKTIEEYFRKLATRKPSGELEK